MYKNNVQKGFSLVELLIGIAIVAVLSLAVTSFSRNIISYNRSIAAGLRASDDGRLAVEDMAQLLREAGPSATGGFPFSEASTSAVTFYTDIDHNGIQDQVEYYVASSTLLRSVLAPSGSPLSYDTSGTSTVITTLAQDVESSSTLPLFQYYDGNYTGTSSPLSQPVDPQNIRLIKISLIIDGVTFTTDVSIRNLKDNL